MANLFQAFHRAQELHVAGRLDEAEEICRNLLEKIPEQPDTLDELGLIRLHTGRPSEAVELFRRAIEREPRVRDFHAHFGLALEACGRPRDAARALVRGAALLMRAGATWSEYGAFFEHVRRYDADTRDEACEVLLSELSDVDATMRLSSAFFVTGDVVYLEELIETVSRVPPPLPVIRHIYWGIALRLFQGCVRRGDAGAFHQGPFADFWRLFVRETARVCDPAPMFGPRRRITALRRVAVITNQMLNERHQPTTDVLELAHKLREERGLDTLIVNTNALPTGDDSAFIPRFTFNVADMYEGDKRLSLGAVSARVISREGGPFDRDGVRATLALIEDFDPDAVLAFGGGNIYADLLVGRRPVVCLPTVSGYTHSAADLVLGYSDDDETGGRSGEELTRFRRNSFGFAIREAGPDIPLSDFGLPDDGDLFLVVGNRLDIEVTDAFLDAMETLIDRLPTARIVFAGETTTLERRLAARSRADRLHAPGFVGRIREMCRLATAAVNPPRQGGGGSAATALAEGLPVVTTGGDTAAVAGGEMTVADLSAVIDRCVRLATDPSFRYRQRSAARARFEQMGDRSAVARRIVAHLEEAVRLTGG